MIRSGWPVWLLVVVTAVAPISWGTTYLVTSEWLPADRPLWSATLRALPAGLLVLAITRRLPKGHWWWRAAVLGVLNIGAFFALLFVAAYRLPGGVAATLSAVSPLAVLVLAKLALREQPTRWRVGWGMAGVVGVALMVLGPGARLDAWGVAAGVAGVLAMSAGLVLTRRWGNPVGALPLAGWQVTAGGLFLTPLALVIEGPPPTMTPSAVAGYVWLGLAGTLVAYTVWFRAVGLLPVTAVAFLTLLSPVVATLLGWLVLGQSLTLLQGVGFGLTLVALIASQWRPGSWTMRRSRQPKLARACA
ncbi:EamA family transporter [Microlunatus sp. Y2014]|uniref:EamA family transporter n=1 Tax=Microlunatus sp. Y2014 TaxID=3418488 RepID=UPI003DA6F64B